MGRAIRRVRRSQRASNAWGRVTLGLILIAVVVDLYLVYAVFSRQPS